MIESGAESESDCSQFSVARCLEIDDYSLKHLVLHGIPFNPPSIRPRVWNRLLAITQSIPSNYHGLISSFNNSFTCFTHSNSNSNSDSDSDSNSDSNSDSDILHPININSPIHIAKIHLHVRQSLKLPLPNFNHSFIQLLSHPTTKNSTQANHSGPLSLILSRIIAISLSLNPAIRYHPQMATIAAVLLAVFSNSDDSTTSSIHPNLQPDHSNGHHHPVEALAFSAFSALLANLAPIFISPAIPDDHSPLAPLCAQYARQLLCLDRPLSDHLAANRIDPSLYLPLWLRSLFVPCLAPQDLLILWDVLLALNLDSHHSPSHLPDTLIDLSCALTLLIGPRLRLQTRPAHLLNTLQNIRPEALPISDIVNQLLAIRQRRLAQALGPHLLLPQPVEPVWEPDHVTPDGWPEDDEDDSAQSPLDWLGLRRLKALATESVQRPSSSGAASAGLLDKLRTRAEVWKDSDAAAALSKRATNWSLIASSWRTPTVVIKQHPSSPVAGFSLSRHPDLGSSHSPGSARSSKVSSVSTVSLDSPFRPPVSSASSLSQCSSSIGSPVHQTLHPSSSVPPGSGPKPLLLSARARTTVPLGPEPNGLVQEMVASSLKRLSALKLGGQPRSADDRLARRPHPILTHAPLADQLLSPSPPFTGVGGQGRHRARSVLTSPTSQHSGQMAGRRAGRTSLPEMYSPSRDRAALVEAALEEEEPDEAGPGYSPTKSRIVVGGQIGAHCDDECGEGGGKGNSLEAKERESGDEVDAYVSLYDT